MVSFAPFYVRRFELLSVFPRVSAQGNRWIYVKFAIDYLYKIL